MPTNKHAFFRQVDVYAAHGGNDGRSLAGPQGALSSNWEETSPTVSFVFRCAEAAPLKCCRNVTLPLVHAIREPTFARAHPNDLIADLESVNATR